MYTILNYLFILANMESGIINEDVAGSRYYRYHRVIYVVQERRKQKIQQSVVALIQLLTNLF